MFTYDTADKNGRQRSDDRILVLRPMEGKNSLTNIGMIDNKLFTGENKLHGIMDPETCHWHFKYEMGVLPSPLKSNFTSFKKLKDYAVDYFKKRNIDIIEIID